MEINGFFHRYNFGNWNSIFGPYYFGQHIMDKFLGILVIGLWILFGITVLLGIWRGEQEY